MVSIPNTESVPATEVTTPIVAETKKARKAREAAEKKAATPVVEVATPEVKDPDALSGREALALHLIACAPRIGAELSARMGKGISRMMGCSTKEAGVSPGLCGRGFAVVKITESATGGNRHEYHITDAGRAALAKCDQNALTEAAAKGEERAVVKTAEKVAAKAEKAAAAPAVTVPTGVADATPTDAPTAETAPVA